MVPQITLLQLQHVYKFYINFIYIVYVSISFLYFIYYSVMYVVYTPLHITSIKIMSMCIYIFVQRQTLGLVYQARNSSGDNLRFRTLTDC